VPTNGYPDIVLLLQVALAVVDYLTLSMKAGNRFRADRKNSCYILLVWNGGGVNSPLAETARWIKVTPQGVVGRCACTLCV
jgi:hypothetical protein